MLKKHQHDQDLHSISYTQQRMWLLDRLDPRNPAYQDPHYREIFYNLLLPDLAARGKTSLVISHDDRYYHRGDRIVKLEYGGLVSDTRVKI